MEDEYMLYLIRSINWTRHYRKDTYWGPNENGYTSTIADAGFYPEDEARKIVSLSSGNAEMIPVTKEILDRAYQQLKKKRKEILAEREYEENQYKRMLEDFDKRDDLVDNGYNQLNNIAEQLGI